MKYLKDLWAMVKELFGIKSKQHDPKDGPRPVK